MTDDTRVDSQAIDCRNRRMALHMRVAALIVFIAVAVTAAPPSPLHEAMARVQSAAAGTDHEAYTPPLREAKGLVPAAPAGGEPAATQNPLHVYPNLSPPRAYCKEARTAAVFVTGE